MKLAAPLGAAAALGFAAWLLAEPGMPAPPAPAVHVPAATLAPPAVAAPAVAPVPAAAATTPAAPAGVTVDGVVVAGRDSQALLRLDGQSPQPFRVGDPVAAGWSVHAIREQEVVLGNGASRASLAVAGAPDVPPPPGATFDAAPAAAARLPGFVAGPPPRLAEAGAAERNRRFLAAVQARQHARQ